MPVAPPTTTPTNIESCDLWVPSGSVSHVQWLTHLVTSLIDSGAIEDEVLVLTRNVCSVKVSTFTIVEILELHIASMCNGFHLT